MTASTNAQTSTGAADPDRVEIWLPESGERLIFDDGPAADRYALTGERSWTTIDTLARDELSSLTWPPVSMAIMPSSTPSAPAQCSALR